MGFFGCKGRGFGVLRIIHSFPYPYFSLSLFAGNYGESYLGGNISRIFLGIFFLFFRKKKIPKIPSRAFLSRRLGRKRRHNKKNSATYILWTYQYISPLPM